MWLLIGIMLFRLIVNVCLSSWVVCKGWMAMSIALSFALRMFW